MVLRSGLLQEQLIDVVETSFSPTLRYLLEQSPPDQEGIANLLESVGSITDNTVPLSFDATGEMLVIGRDRTLLGARPSDLMGNEAIGRLVDTQLLPGLADPLQAALAGSGDVDQLYTRPGSAEKVVMVVPIWDINNEQVLGAFVGIEDSPTVIKFVADALPILIISLLSFTLFAGLIGTAYGYFAANEPVKQLERLSHATIAWSQGDFSARVEESTGDEFGQLAGRLNNMAQQLAQLIETRRDLAVMDERNRLARELHDSAKQLAFAASAQLGGVRSLLQRNPAEAVNHLAETERLLDQLRRELTSMILELRPPALTGEGLDAALRNYLTEWQRHNDIETQLHLQDVRSLPLETQQSLFRILQESLANVARHSKARNITVTLVFSPDDVTMKVKDDGCGFDVNSVPGGFGLSSMKQRAEALDGLLTVSSSAGQGTTISCTIPVGLAAANGAVIPNG